jgi:short subunit fatty acids transporter
MSLLGEFLSAFVTEGAFLRVTAGPIAVPPRRSRGLTRAAAIAAAAAPLAWGIGLLLSAGTLREAAALVGYALLVAALLLALAWLVSGHTSPARAQRDRPDPAHGGGA